MIGLGSLSKNSETFPVGELQLDVTGLPTVLRNLL